MPFNDREYYLANKEQINERRRRRYRDDPERFRGQKLKQLYDLSPEEYKQRVEQQGGLCRICERSCPTGRQLSVDHDHTTGKIRGLLCGNCNTALGKFDDRVDLLEKAISYLKGKYE